MTHKHTPGPWAIKHDKQRGRFQVYSGVKYENALFVTAECPKWDGKEDRANARLIAAAPELLETLKAITASYEDLLKIAGAKVHVDLAGQSRKAISKATGE